MSSEIKANKISPATGTAFQFGDSGDTFTVPSGTTLDIASGATIANSGTATGFSESPVKVWVNFNGTGTVAIRDSLNVSSITDNGTGDYTVNFTSAMSDANYAVTAASFLNSTVGSAIAVFNYTTSNVQIKTSSHNANCGSFQDQDPISVVVTGN